MTPKRPDAHGNVCADEVVASAFRIADAIVAEAEKGAGPAR
jgi:hypothetical protein